MQVQTITTEVKQGGSLSDVEKSMFRQFYLNFYQNSLKGTKFIDDEGPEFDYFLPAFDKALDDASLRVVIARRNDASSSSLAGFTFAYPQKEFRGEQIAKIRFTCYDNSLGHDGACTIQQALTQKMIATLPGVRFYGFLRTETQDQFIKQMTSIGMEVETEYANFPDDIYQTCGQLKPINQTNWICIWHPKPKPTWNGDMVAV